MFQGRIICKGCGEVFNSIEWLNNTKCCEPNCTCPRVQDVKMRARQAIARANETSTKEIQRINVVTRSAVPHGFVEGRDQLCIPVPDVKVIELPKYKE